MDLWIWIVLALIVLLLLASSVRRMRPQTQRPPTPLEPTALPPEARAEIDRLIADGKRINAIKVLRDHTGIRLKEAKDRIDAWS